VNLSTFAAFFAVLCGLRQLYEVPVRIVPSKWHGRHTVEITWGMRVPQQKQKGRQIGGLAEVSFSSLT
jgi:hypothetical protein